MMRPLHWGPVRPYQPPAGLAILRVQFTAEQYQERKAERPDALEDCHINDGGYYRRLCYQTGGVWVEASGPQVKKEYKIYD